jgi:hypothetical protein
MAFNFSKRKKWDILKQIVAGAPNFFPFVNGKRQLYLFLNVQLKKRNKKRKTANLGVFSI